MGERDPHHDADSRPPRLDPRRTFWTGQYRLPSHQSFAHGPRGKLGRPKPRVCLLPVAAPEGDKDTARDLCVDHSVVGAPEVRSLQQAGHSDSDDREPALRSVESVAG
jgi:hypothetical protein